MLGKSLVVLSLFTAALFTWIFLGSLKQDNCINSNSIRNIIIFNGKSKKLVPHCNDLKLNTEYFDYNEVKIIRTVNSYSKHWFFDSKQTPKKFPIRKIKSDSPENIELSVLSQMLHFNFFRSKTINWIEQSYLNFLKKVVLNKDIKSQKFTKYLKQASHCDGCQSKVIANVSDAPQEFYNALTQFTSNYLYQNYINSSLKQKLMFDYFIRRGDLDRSLNTIKTLIEKASFKKLNLASQIKTIMTWMTFYSQQNTKTPLNLNLSHDLLPTSYEFYTSLPIVWEDLLPIKNKKVQVKINNNKYDLVYGWILNLNEKISRNKQVFLFQCNYPKLRKAMTYLYKTQKLTYVKICNVKQMLKVLKVISKSNNELNLAQSKFKYVEYNLSSLKLVEKKLNDDFLLKPQNLSSVLYWEDLIKDPVTKITQPKAAIEGVVSFRN